MKLEKAIEDGRVGGAGLDYSGAKEWGAIHQEKGAGHEMREAMHGGVGELVLSKVIGFEGYGKSEGLAEAEGEAFAGDGVDGAGGVADQGDVAAGDAMESAAEGDGAARSAGGWSGSETALKFGEVCEGLCDAEMFAGGDEGYADFVGCDGCDVGLAMVAPVDLYVAAPGTESEVLAEADAAGGGNRAIESGPGADAGLVAVGSYDVAGGESGAIGADGLRPGDVGGGVDSLHQCLPVEADA